MFHHGGLRHGIGHHRWCNQETLMGRGRDSTPGNGRVTGPGLLGGTERSLWTKGPIQGISGRERNGALATDRCPDCAAKACHRQAGSRIPLFLSLVNTQ